MLRRGNVSDPSASTAQRISAAQHGDLGQSEVQNAGSPGVALHLRSGQAPGRQFIAKDGIHQSKLNKKLNSQHSKIKLFITKIQYTSSIFYNQTLNPISF